MQEDNKEDLLNFLKSQKLLVIASKGDDVWISNLYYGIGDDFKIYFIGSKDTKRSKQILDNPNVAFSVAWFNENNHADRKAVQGTGKCRVASNDEEIKKGVELHNKNFPEFKERITFDWIKDNNSKVWVIEPDYIKFWNDELFGLNGTKDFTNF